ncbi:hypothetical protein SAMN05216420_101483 [Nitrosospira sp. Nl5]|nr:hypothetical protein SAMN05216420_101483 [Nitrosospira sp. Nl5]
MCYWKHIYMTEMYYTASQVILGMGLRNRFETVAASLWKAVLAIVQRLSGKNYASDITEVRRIAGMLKGTPIRPSCASNDRR